MRKEGELFGNNQSGVIGFKIANISRDGSILLDAKKDSEEFIEEKRYLNKEYYLNIIRNIKSNLD